MKKTLIAAALCLSACTPAGKQQTNTYDFRIAVLDNGASGSQITWYGDDYEELGRTVLENRFFNPAYSFKSDSVYHDNDVYIQPAEGRGNRYEIIRMNLENGSLDFIPLDAFAIGNIFDGGEYLLAVQLGTDYGYYRLTKIPYDESSIVSVRSKDGEQPGIFIPLDNGWLHFKNIPDYSLIRYDENFEIMDERLIGNRSVSMSETMPENAFGFHLAQTAVIDGAVYISVARENRQWEKTDEGFWAASGMGGYTYGIMKINPETLDYEMIGDPDQSYQDMEQLDEKRIAFITAAETIAPYQVGDGTVYINESSDWKIQILDTETDEMTPVETGYHPVGITRAADAVYVLDTEGKIHVMDPESLKEIKSFVHDPGDIQYTAERLIVSQPYR